MKRAILLAACLLAFVAPAHAQPRAPAGGMYVGDKFYAGGQFIPNSAGGLGMGGGAGGGGFYLGPMPAAGPYRPMTTARRLARVKARTSARTTASAGTSIAINLPSLSAGTSKGNQGTGAGGKPENALNVDGVGPVATEAAEPQSDAAKLAETRIRTAKNLMAINKNAQAKEWLELVVKMNASPETVKEAKNLLASIAK